ncbi:MAG TPA: EamA family transporter, partial [Pseudomonadota bacterium]|nr:EamA family transporter [Pseudomonadota bacterium]
QSEGSWEIFLAFCLIGALITAVPTAAHWVMPSGPAVAWLLAVGVSSVTAQILMTHALRDVPALHAGLILQLTPIATFAIGVSLLHERPATLGFVGAAVTIVGVTWGVRAQTSSRAPRR